MLDRRLLPLAVAFITACNPSAPLLLPTIDTGSAVDGATTDRSVGVDATDAAPVDVPSPMDAPVIDIVLADVPDVPVVPDVPDVPGVMDVVPAVDVIPSVDVTSTVDVPDVPLTVDVPDVPPVVDGGTCPTGMALIPAGTFTMGDTSPDSNGADPPHVVTLSAFCMDINEVTVAAYSACSATGCTTPQTQTGCNWGVAGRGDHPINCVDWNQSSAFCRWRGGSLPTEAQWEYAACGADGRTYPWGESAPGPLVCWSGTGSRATTCPVGSFPAGRSPFGIMDMGGSVYEWATDWLGPYGSAPQTNPTGPSSGTRRVLRGGCWGNRDAIYMRATRRDGLSPTNQNIVDGIRCARAPL
ncbi:MAG: SUMF1/EgtB/PvdO family nonheme iron enzyme [Deltaproteobacteria bacterium]|nr:SUMF1/EgtB/PvdO family nonheme iron enzyme [Myxococcales bacterium]MDP3213953.1 SUMF1/EgtB/PvdO family nonheme iron enzyme [Deltaproteobacteria bacterium]